MASKAIGSATSGESTGAGRDLADASRWPLEQIALKDGRTFEGLALARSEREVQFEVVSRPRGRPMYLVVRRFPAASIASLKPLADPERTELAARIEHFKKRAERESLEVGKIQLTPSTEQGSLNYRGPWFELESRTDESMTRRTILRLEQIFTAYSEILPTRASQDRPLKILLYGSMRDYSAFLNQHDYRFENPAVFIPRLNTLAAGSELSAYAARLADVHRKHEKIRRQFREKGAAMPGELQKLARDLEAQKVPAPERKTIVAAAQRNWDQEQAEAHRRMEVLERENAAQFDEITRKMFTRLFHEAFHAYVENFVYPQEKCDVPRWLNEGLAQVFEEGILELGALRLDAPSRKRLAAMQADLRSHPRLALAELLRADGRAFLVAHPTDAKTSQRYYLYSWALAYYLAVREPVLETEKFNRYVDARARTIDPIARFEQLVGVPLDRFESNWREELLALKPPD